MSVSTAGLGVWSILDIELEAERLCGLIVSSGIDIAIPWCNTRGSFRVRLLPPKWMTILEVGLCI